MYVIIEYYKGATRFPVDTDPEKMADTFNLFWKELQAAAKHGEENRKIELAMKAGEPRKSGFSDMSDAEADWMADKAAGRLDDPISSGVYEDEDGVTHGRSED